MSLRFVFIFGYCVFSSILANAYIEAPTVCQNLFLDRPKVTVGLQFVDFPDCGQFAADMVGFEGDTFRYTSDFYSVQIDGKRYIEFVGPRGLSDGIIGYRYATEAERKSRSHYREGPVYVFTTPKVPSSYRSDHPPLIASVSRTRGGYLWRIPSLETIQQKLNRPLENGGVGGLLRVAGVSVPRDPEAPIGTAEIDKETYLRGLADRMLLIGLYEDPGLRESMHDLEQHVTGAERLVRENPELWMYLTDSLHAHLTQLDRLPKDAQNRCRQKVEHTWDEVLDSFERVPPGFKTSQNTFDAFALRLQKATNELLKASSTHCH